MDKNVGMKFCIIKELQGNWLIGISEFMISGKTISL